MMKSERLEAEELAGSGAVARLIGRVGEAVAIAEDNEDERLRKAVMTFSVYLICFGGLFWGVIYGWLGLWSSAVIPLGYTVLSLLNVAVLYRTKNDRFFLLTQLLLILLLPFALQWSAGGFVSSGAVMLWAILAPVGALMFHSIDASVRWFIAYLLLVAASAVVESGMSGSPVQIPEAATTAFFVSNVTLVSSILFLVLRHFVSETETAKKKSDGLLFHMLPLSITDRLKNGEAPIADRIDKASVVFADMVSFTELSDSLEPEQLVELLNDLYGAFDQIANQLGMEKIRTVGDSYIAVAGIPQPRKDHALRAVEMATRMRGHLSTIGPERWGRPISMRFGVHCGPVVAAVIGNEKLNYEVWGDTVNVASRMESTARPGQIQVTEAVYKEVRGRYEMTRCGAINIKGKGRMKTYLVGDLNPLDTAALKGAPRSKIVT